MILNALSSTVTGCIFISAFASVVDVSVGITSSTIGPQIFVITAGFKKHMSKMKKK